MQSSALQFYFYFAPPPPTIIGMKNGIFLSQTKITKKMV